MGNGHSRAQRASIAERRAKLIKYRLAGRPYDDFWQELGYSSRDAATKDFCRALEQNIAEQRTSMEVYREAELMRLDQLTLEAVKILATRHLVVAPGGKVVHHPETGQPLEDDAIRLAAIDRLIKIQDRRAKLLGLDAPQRMEVLTIDAIDAAIADLNQRIAAADAEAAQAAAAEGTTS